MDDNCQVASYRDWHTLVQQGKAHLKTGIKGRSKPFNFDVISECGSLIQFRFMYLYAQFT